VIDDRAGGAVALHDRRAANGTHVNEKIACRVDDGLRTAQGDDRVWNAILASEYSSRCSEGGEF